MNTTNEMQAKQQLDKIIEDANYSDLFKTLHAQKAMKKDRSKLTEDKQLEVWKDIMKDIHG